MERRTLRAISFSVIMLAAMLLVFPNAIAAPSGWNSDVRLTTDTGSSYNPGVAVDGNTVHVVWRDERDGNTEIYYKQKPNQPPTADTLDFSDSHVYKDEILTIYANASDDNDQESELTPHVQYKPASSSSWQDTAISAITWDSTGWFWTATFVPTEEMSLGKYHFRVKFTDSDGSDSIWNNGTEQIDVRVHPTATLTASETNINEGETITFDASASIGKNLVYYFDFGDNVTIDWGTTAVRNHTYSTEGIYIAKVKIKDAYDEESLWSSIEITVGKQEEGTPGFQFMLLLAAAFIALLVLQRRHG
ncbi:MAG: PKD domain-containing protein [Thermoplasmatota archaeon]